MSGRIELREGTILRVHLRAEANKIFVFGDNDDRYGLGGQAKEMRSEPNAVGVRTKRSPNTNHSGNKSSYYSDEKLMEQMQKIAADIAVLEYWLEEGKTIVIPSSKNEKTGIYKMEIGTGYAQLEMRAPRTWKYLQEKLHRLRLQWQHD